MTHPVRRPPTALTLRLCALTSLVVAVAGCSSDPAGSPSDDTVTSSPAGAPTPSEAAPTSSSTASPTSPSTPPSTSQGPVRATDLITGLTSPWGLITFDDGSMLVSERDTTEIKLVPAGGGRVETVATIDAARPSGEAGLLGLATTPEEDRVFVYYTSEADNRIASMTWDGRRLGDPEVIFGGIPHGDGNRHEGGRLLVGPDGLLYVSTGETGNTPEISQDRDSLGGKILRLTLDGRPAPGNPDGTAVYSLGHRNVEGLAFDDEGRLWASEFGDSTWDELNLIEAGNNYGWPEVEGSSDREEFTNPAVVWRPDQASPAGLAFWQGSLWMAGLRGETLWEVPLRGGRTADPVAHLDGTYGRLRTVEVAADGGSLVLGTSNTDGRGDPQNGDDRLLRVTR